MKPGSPPVPGLPRPAGSRGGSATRRTSSWSCAALPTTPLRPTRPCGTGPLPHPPPPLPSSTARRPLAAALAAALADLGLAPADAALMTRLLLREYGCGPGDPTVPPGDDAEFTSLIALVARTVRDDLLTVTEVPLIAGDPGGPLVMCITSEPGSEPEELQERAREAVLRHVIPLLAENSQPLDQPGD